jgi:indole-3-glycerol phosphate synthase
MKDIVIVADQIEVAAQIGADAVLLIEALFEKGCCEMSLDKTISFAHSRGLEVLLETHNEDEFKLALESDTELVGINNRNLATLKIDLNTTKNTKKTQKQQNNQIKALKPKPTCSSYETAPSSNNQALCYRITRKVRVCGPMKS